jgi:hypothetical protein
MATKKTARPKKKATSRDKEGQEVKRAKPRKKQGRKSEYTEAMAKKILDAISSSANGLDKICTSNPGFPAPSTVRAWLRANEDFQTRYTRAREDQADFIADEIMQITDELYDKRELTHEQIGAARLRIDARKWVAAKLKPKKYGDKTDITTDGESLNKGFYDFLKETATDDI